MRSGRGVEVASRLQKAIAVNDRERVPSERYFAAAEYFQAKGMAALARKMTAKGNEALRQELIASTKRLHERNNGSEEQNG